jgi:hypothetical protein
MTTENKTLNAIDFMMMDVHRELDEENFHPETLLDKSARPQKEEHGDDTGVGVSHPKIRLLDPLPENVEVLDVSTSHKLQVQRVLQSALDWGLQEVMVIGWHDNHEVYFLSSDPSIGNAIYRMELAKMKLLTAVKDRWNIEGLVTRDQPDTPGPA